MIGALFPPRMENPVEADTIKINKMAEFLAKDHENALREAIVVSCGGREKVQVVMTCLVQTEVTTSVAAESPSRWNRKCVIDEKRIEFILVKIIFDDPDVISYLYRVFM